MTKEYVMHDQIQSTAYRLQVLLADELNQEEGGEGLEGRGRELR